MRSDVETFSSPPMIASLLYPQVKASRANEFMIMNPPTETSVAPDLGAVEILGPGDEGHDSHVHCAWKS